MKQLYPILISLLFVLSCKSVKNNGSDEQKNTDESLSKVVVTFGSCNNHILENVFWDDIPELNPDIFIWGGDIIYADTDDMEKLQTMYSAQNAVPAYAELKEKVEVIGTWDDHDYGLNDGGTEFHAKKESQEVFLDFMGVSDDSPRREREGVYAAHEIKRNGKTVKILVLDTRYFRDAMTKSTIEGRRYEANPYGQGSVLGQEQWSWLANELKNSDADFNIIVTSIQFLSSEHGFEKWGNFPHEVDRMYQTIVDSGAKGVLFLSGDRHISEFSRTSLDELNYPIIDFTSSGLTHSYADFTSEPNAFRVGEVISSTSYGVVEIDLNEREVVFKILGDNNVVLEQLKQRY